MFANLLYLAALVVTAPLIIDRMVRHRRYRRGIAEKLLGLSRRRGSQLRGDGACVWLHAVSVGEVNLLSAVVDRLHEAAPGVAIAISTSTDSGYDLAVKKFGAKRVFFCPLDFTWAVRRTLRNLNPAQVVLVELELWPNLIRACDRYRCPVRVINGRLSERSARRYLRWKRFLRPTFARLSWVGCQDEASRDRFVACGVPADRVDVTGSIKFDNAPTARDTPDVQSRVDWSGADPWHRVWVVGSTQNGEESMAIDIYRHLIRDHPELRLILVPRHAERFEHCAALIAAGGLNVHRRSRDASLINAAWDAETVILIDTIGELRHWWGVGQIATVGGTFGSRGGQNMLEPAGYGCAISFGPDTRNFSSIAQALLDAGGAVRTVSRHELAEFIRRCLTDIPAADGLGRAARQVVLRHRGAIDRTVAALLGSPPVAGTRHAA